MVSPIPISDTRYVWELSETQPIEHAKLKRNMAYEFNIT